MSTILLAEQSMPQELRMEERFRGLGHQVTSIADADLLNMVKMHPYDMIVWSCESLDEHSKEYVQQIRKTTQSYHMDASLPYSTNLHLQ